MRHITLFMLTVCLLASSISTQAQTGDSTSRKKDTFSVSIGGRNVYGKDSDSTKRDSVKRKRSRTGFMGGITFTRIDLGFSRLIDNGSFTLSPANDFLDFKPGKTSAFSFDILQYGYRFNPNFKIYLAGGFDWTLIRLKRNITLENNEQDLSYIEEPVQFSKNRLSSSYVHFPLNFEFRTKENDKGNRFFFVVGPEIGFLLNGKIKQISDERGKQKVRDDYHFQPVRYGGTLRLGYGSLGIFTKYYTSDMFDSPAQSGLKNMSFGVTLGLN